LKFSLLKVLYHPVHNLEIIGISFSFLREDPHSLTIHRRRDSVSGAPTTFTRSGEWITIFSYRPRITLLATCRRALSVRAPYAQADRLRSFHIAREWRFSLPHHTGTPRSESKARKPTRKPFSVYGPSSRERDRRGRIPCPRRVALRSSPHECCAHACTHACDACTPARVRIRTWERVWDWWADRVCRCARFFFPYVRTVRSSIRLPRLSRLYNGVVSRKL